MKKQRRKLAPPPGGLKTGPTVQKLGGVQAVAEMLGLTTPAVYSWGMYVPRKHQAVLGLALEKSSSKA